MSEAGKDANARPQLAGDSLPVRTIARVAPQSVQLAKDHALLGRSVWCGLVCALVAVITVVNLLPPAGVGYQVTNQILVSPKRFELLQQELKKSVPTSSEATLVEVKLLDEAKTQRLANQNESQVLLQVRSQWAERTTAARLQRWLNVFRRLMKRPYPIRMPLEFNALPVGKCKYASIILNNIAMHCCEKVAEAADQESLADSKTKLPSNIKLASNPDKPKVKFATLGEIKDSVGEPAAGPSCGEATLELSGRSWSKMHPRRMTSRSNYKKSSSRLDGSSKM